MKRVKALKRRILVRPATCPWCGRRPLVKYCTAVSEYEIVCEPGCPVGLCVFVGPNKKAGILKWNKRKRAWYAVDSDGC